MLNIVKPDINVAIHKIQTNTEIDIVVPRLFHIRMNREIDGSGYDFCATFPTSCKKSSYEIIPIYLHAFYEYQQYQNKHKYDDIVKFVFSEYIPNNHKYILFQRGDYRSLFNYPLDNIIIVKHSSLPDDNSYAIPYKIDDKIFEYKNIESSYYDISFMGCTFSGGLVRRNLKHYLNHNKSKFRIKYVETQLFWSKNITNTERDKMRVPYNQLLNESKFVFCPEGSGTNSYRFYESLKTGRIPILIANTKLPFEWLIDYDKFVVKIKPSEVLSIDDKVSDFMQNNNLQEVSQLCKEVYNKYLIWQPIQNLQHILVKESKCCF